MTENKTYTCRGCDQRLPGDRFEWITDKNGRRAPRKQCLVCNGSLGHKPCSVCKEDKPIDQFGRVDNGNAYYYRRDCWACVYQRQRKGLPPQKRGPKPGAVASSKKRQAGWTPPPTRNELAALHASYLPPPGWSPPPGELPDTEYGTDDQEEEAVPECA